MADKALNTRHGRTKADIAQDFAEQLKYNLDADVYHSETTVAIRLPAPRKCDGNQRWPDMGG